VQVLYFGVEVKVEGKVGIVAQVVDLREDIQVREVHLQHAAQGE
jgi:hypothetical protein